MWYNFCGKCWDANIQMKALSGIFLMYQYHVTLVVLPVACDHSSESHWEVLSCGAVDYAVQFKVVLLSSLWVKSIEVKATEQ